MLAAQAPISEQSIRFFKGVGPKRTELLAQLGIETVEDALYHSPNRYEDRTAFAEIASLVPGTMMTLRGQIVGRNLRRLPGGRTLLDASVSDRTGVLQVRWFNAHYLQPQLGIGRFVILHGRIEPGRQLTLVHPEIEYLDAPQEQSIHMGRIVPVYPLTAGVSQRWMRELLWSIVEAHAGDVPEMLPEPLRAGRGWMPAVQAIRELHFPSSMASMEAARERLAFEELLCLQVALSQRRARTEAVKKNRGYQLEGPVTQGLAQRLPFTMTAAQQRVLRELLDDLGKPSPMHRLLQGDVGCGKTIVMVWLLAVAAQSGVQAAVMAPTELLAEQHLRLIKHLLEPLGVHAVSIAQGVPPQERAERVKAVAEGKAAVVVGTHALLERAVRFKNLGLVVIDEQHKFGVTQRALLASKARDPDVLIMTATPIPRTLALSLYGDLSVSTIDAMPPGRSPIRTEWLGEEWRAGLYGRIRAELIQGRQAYLVYPAVDATLAKDLKAAVQMAKRLTDGAFAEFKVGLLHGQMKPQEKERVMREFAEGRVQLLISTVIVEVGLDVPNATVMAIEHPERFGLAQLHQLRGRIGRGEHPSQCLLIGDTTDETVRERLQAFVSTLDGFALAEKDLELRGPGELFGKRQSGGWWRFRIANLIRDRVLLEQARAAGEQLVRQDAQLAAAELAPLRERVARFRMEPKP